MNIAVCFWGLTRSLKYTHENIKKVLDGLAEFGDVTTFMHTYKIFREYSNQWGKEEAITLDPNEYKILDPDHFIWDDQDEIAKGVDFKKYHTFPDEYKTDYQTINNFVIAMYSLKRVTELMLRHNKTKKYTHVIFMRPDVIFDSPIKKSFLEAVNDTNIVTPQFGKFHAGKNMINDRFAICTPHVASIYGLRLKVLLEYSKVKRILTEEFLYDVMKLNNIKIIWKWICFNRVRADGRISNDCKTEY